MSDKGDKAIADRLVQARKAIPGLTSASKGADFLGVKYPTYAGHENGSRGLTRETLEAYARRYRVSVDWLLTGRGEGPKPQQRSISVGLSAPPGKVPLVGRVGAGQAVYPLDENGEWADEPADSKPGTVAVEVSGDSMFPAYEEGTLLYYSRMLPPEHMINRRAIVKLADGSMLVKVLRRGSADGLWVLQSINSMYQDIVDRAVEWAAPIEWTKPHDGPTAPARRNTAPQLIDRDSDNLSYEEYGTAVDNAPTIGSKPK